MKKNAKNAMIAITLSMLLSSTALLSGCDWQEDFHINSYELVQEYFPKYIESASEIIDKYNIEYTLETQIHHNVTGRENNDSSYFYYTYTINDDFLIQIGMFYDDISPKVSHFGVYLSYDSETLPKTREVCEEYGDMVNEIIYFFGNNVPEIDGLYLELYEEVIQKFDGSDMVLKKRYSDDGLFGAGMWKGYYVSLEFLNESQKYQVSLYGGCYLSDKNVWEE